MARRKKTSTADDLLELVAVVLPRWASVLLALVSYFVLHNISSHSVVACMQPGQMGAMGPPSIWRSLATAGQYFVPFIWLLGSVISD